MFLRYSLGVQIEFPDNPEQAGKHRFVAVVVSICAGISSLVTASQDHSLLAFFAMLVLTGAIVWLNVSTFRMRPKAEQQQLKWADRSYPSVLIGYMAYRLWKYITRAIYGGFAR
jgi:hypothetical protein